MPFQGFTEDWLEQRRSGGAASAEGRSDLPDGVTHAAGVDPGANTGIVLWDVHAAQIADVFTEDFHFALDLLQQFEPGTLYVVLETPKENSFMYGRHTKKLKSAIRRGSFGAAWKQAKIAMRMAMKVGENQKEGELLREHAEQCGHPLRTVRPTSKKWDADMAHHWLGYPPPNENPYYNNEHVRDALRFLHDASIIPRGGCRYLADD